MQLIKNTLGADALVPLFYIDFERNLADVAEYRRLRGSFPVQGGDAHRLATWLTRCRRAANSGLLLEAYAPRLDSVLGAEWRSQFKSHTVCSHATTPYGNLV